jgi:site-specific DNA-methyltransferase (adenine-specific)
MTLELNKIYHGDLIEIMREFPAESFDLVFADPPYNLAKLYSEYEDNKKDKEYIEWCNRWLKQYVRVLKPTGSLFVINLPRWSYHHAIFLNKYLYFRHWIAWDALSEPRGKVMPAHYAILYYTKSKSKFTFNDIESSFPPNLCYRLKCIKNRPSSLKKPLSDIWTDIHRIKHKKDRDAHPCQLPIRLLERIILIASNEGDIIFDGFVGTGSTVIAAKKLNRSYIGIDIDKKYIDITEKKIKTVISPLNLPVSVSI